jgi:hypothetical protein
MKTQEIRSTKDHAREVHAIYRNVSVSSEKLDRRSRAIWKPSSGYFSGNFLFVVLLRETGVVPCCIAAVVEISRLPLSLESEIGSSALGLRISHVRDLLTPGCRAGSC